MTRLFRRTGARLRTFAREADGYVNVEVAILIPLLLWIFGACWVLFDAFHQQSEHQKANYVIGDMISRESDPLDATYIDNARRLLDMLTKSGSEDSALRITVAAYDEELAVWNAAWSRTSGDADRLDDDTLAEIMDDSLPTALNNDQIIIVESWEDFVPTFAIGLDVFTIRSFSFTSPRYTSQVLYETADGTLLGQYGSTGSSNGQGSGGNSDDGESDPWGGGGSSQCSWFQIAFGWCNV